MCRTHDLVDIALLIGKASVHGIGTRMVRHVAVDMLAAGIAQQQTSRLERTRVVVVVQHLAVLREDRRKRHTRTVRHGNAVHGTRDLMLTAARTAQTHGRGVHVVTDIECLLDTCKLLVRLNLTHLRNRKEQVERHAVVHHRRHDAQQLRYLKRRLAAIRGQVVYLASLSQGVAQIRRQRRHGPRLRHPNLGREIRYRRLRAPPDDILNRKVIAIERLGTAVGVDNTRQGGQALSEKVEERRILTEVVGVAGIVHGRLVIARQQDQSAADSAAKLRTALRISLCRKHNLPVFIYSTIF